MKTSKIHYLLFQSSIFITKDKERQKIAVEVKKEAFDADTDDVDDTGLTENLAIKKNLWIGRIKKLN